MIFEAKDRLVMRYVRTEKLCLIEEDIMKEVIHFYRLRQGTVT